MKTGALTAPLENDEENMLCHDVRVELPALLAGELNATSRAAVERHLSFCPGCRFAWRKDDLVWQCLSGCKDIEPPAELEQRVVAAIQQYERGQR